MPNLEQLFSTKETFVRSGIKLGLSSIHRYGVFATKDISPKEIIEECPVILYRPLNLEYREEISNREFFWDDNNDAIALGYGSLYNHSEVSNATYSIDHNNQIIKFIATKPIAAGAEILINYGKNWFSSRDRKATSIDQEQRKNELGVFKVSILLLVLLVLSKIFPIYG